MKRFLASALIIGASTFGLAGCDQKSTTEQDIKTKTPDGTSEKKIKIEETKSGDMKDPPHSTDAPKP